MQKLLIALSAAATLALPTIAAAACEWHKSEVTASVDKSQESVAMSTHDGIPPIVEEERTAEAAPDCAEGDTDCTPAGK